MFETAESHSFLLAPIQRVDDEHSETEGASAKIKKILVNCKLNLNTHNQEIHLIA